MPSSNNNASTDRQGCETAHQLLFYTLLISMPKLNRAFYYKVVTDDIPVDSAGVKK